MSNRPSIPKPIETELLQLSARRCCLCFGLHQDLEEKKGQIAHLDQEPSNNSNVNLAWLCLEHHDEYDGETSQSKNYTIQEVKKYRNELYKIIAERRIKISERDSLQNNGEDYYRRFSAQYIGRDDNIKYVLGFLNNSDSHFLLLYGVGGMGKSHLISECRKVFSSPDLRQTECTTNFSLKSLFKTCGITFPDEINPDARSIHFIKEFMRQELCLILDDFYETVDKEVRDLLPRLAAIPNGKILLVSRAVPKELERVGFYFDKYLLPPLEREDFYKVMRDYIASEKKAVELSDVELKKIFDKAQGYPLGAVDN